MPLNPAAAVARWLHHACALLLVTAGLARAQALPSRPISLAGGAVTVGGEVSVAFAPPDREAWFNYGDYDHDLMRLVRLGASLAVRPDPHVAVLSELRAEGDITHGDWYGRPYALYIRVRPWLERAFDVQAGRIPPTFGAFGRRSYPSDNPLIGMPLGYQYLTSLRPDAIPATVDDLLRMRGRGWLVRYPVGNRASGPGVPVVNALDYDTGVQARFGAEPISLALGVTTGTLSNPRVRNDNDGVQVAGRLAWQGIPALTIGVSAARGEWLSRATIGALPEGLRHGSYWQRAFGADLEWSRGHWLVRAETISSAWRLPAVRAPFLPSTLDAVAADVEARYRIRPGLYAAVRAGHLGFSDVAGTTATRPWDAPVTRVELGGGYSIQRNVILKAVYQKNRRDGGTFEPRLRLGAVQLLYWF